jgi:ribose transport system permease protein
MTSLWRSSSADWLRRGTVFLILVGFAVFFALTSERFLQLANLGNVAEQNAHVVIVAIGVALTMMLGGIDLSVGSVAALVGAVSAGLIVRDGWTLFAALLAGLTLGALTGAINGVLVVYGKLPPFVATLAMLGVARGLTLVYTEGRPISGFRESGYLAFAGETFGTIPIPTQIMIAAIVVVLAWLLLTRTRFGLHIYAIGGNEETARLAGVPVDRVKVTTYALSGLLAGLTGVLLTARLASAQPNVAVGLELSAIAAAVLGGVSLFGGVGSVLGVIAGALIVGVLNNGMNLLRVPSYPKQIIQGVVLVLAVTIDMYTKRLERR